MAILTNCRRAVWTAIEGWSGLSGEFKRKYKYEDKPGGAGTEPTIGDMPALQIYPAAPTSDWVLNQSQRIDYPLQFTLWTPDWDVTKAEQLWEEIIKALYQNLDPASGTVRRVVNFSPLQGVQMQLGDGQGGPTATRWDFVVTILADFWNPKTAT